MRLCNKFQKYISVLLFVFILVEIIAPPALVYAQSSSGSNSKPDDSSTAVLATIGALAAGVAAYCIAQAVGEVKILGFGIGKVYQCGITNPPGVHLLSADGLKKWIFDPAARLVIRALLHATTQQIVGWIQGGGGKNVGFVGNLTQTLRREADLAGGEFLNNLTGINLCGNIGAFLRITLRTPGLSQQLGCSLTDIERNVDGFYRNFQQGGWKNFFQISLEPQNNPYGAYLIALDAKILAESRARERVDTGIKVGKGFLGQQVPVKKNCRTEGGGAYTGPGSDPEAPVSIREISPLEQIAYATGKDFAGVGINFVKEVRAQNGEISTLPESIVAPPTVTRVEPERGGRAEEVATGANEVGGGRIICDTEYETKTPGNLVSDMLSKSVGSGIDFAQNAKDFDEAIATIINALITKLISSTFSALEDGGESGQGLFDPALSNIPLTGIENAFTFIARANDLLFTSDKLIAEIDRQLSILHTDLFKLRRDLETTRATIATTSDPDTLASLRSTESSILADIQTKETSIASLGTAKTKILQTKSELIDLHGSLFDTTNPTASSRTTSRLPILSFNLASHAQEAGLDVSSFSTISSDVKTGTQQVIDADIGSLNSTMSLLGIVINEADNIASTTPNGAQRAVAESQRDSLRQRVVDLVNKRAAIQIIQGEINRSTRETELNQLIRSLNRPLFDATQEIRRSMDRLRLAVQALQ